MTPDETRELIAELRSATSAAITFMEKARARGRGIEAATYEAEADLCTRAADALAVLSAPQEAKSVAKVVPVSYEASASCSHGVCPSGCSHLMWECTARSCEGGWGVARERLEELAAKHVCVAAAPTPQEGGAREQVLAILADLDYNDGGMMRWHPSGKPTEQAERVADRIAREVFSRAAVPESEWEHATTQWGIDRQPHGRLTRGEITPQQWFAELGDRDDLELVRRRKAGPWLLVNEEGN